MMDMLLIDLKLFLVFGYYKQCYINTLTHIRSTSLDHAKLFSNMINLYLRHLYFRVTTLLWFLSCVYS
jgi:hypothetical protein